MKYLLRCKFQKCYSIYHTNSHIYNLIPIIYPYTWYTHTHAHIFTQLTSYTHSHSHPDIYPSHTRARARARVRLCKLISYVNLKLMRFLAFHSILCIRKSLQLCNNVTFVNAYWQFFDRLKFILTINISFSLRSKQGKAFLSIAHRTSEWINECHRLKGELSYNGSYWLVYISIICRIFV